MVELTDKGNQLDYDIKNFDWSASLVYNVEDKKAVPFINQEPFTYKFSNFNDKKISIECRIVVLTSQHEDVFFLIKISAESKNFQIPHIYTFPIKVISKPEQPRKRKVITENLKPQKKRQTKAEKLLQLLEDIQQKQIKQEENFQSLKQKILNMNMMNINNMNNMNGMNMMNMNNMNNMNNLNMNNMNNMNGMMNPNNFNQNNNLMNSQPINNNTFLTPPVKLPQSYDTNKIKKEKLEFEPLLLKLLEL